MRSTQILRKTIMLAICIAMTFQTLAMSVYAYSPEKKVKPLAQGQSIDDAIIELIAETEKEHNIRLKYVYMVTSNDPLFRDYRYYMCSPKELSIEKDFNSLLTFFKDKARGQGIDIPRVFLGEPNYYDDFEIILIPYDPYASVA